jgi:hypothetical protein
MGPMRVVVLLVGGQDLSGVGLAHGADVIEGLTPDAADDPLSVGIHPVRSRCALEGLYLFGCEDRVQGLAVLVIAVVQ